MTIRTEDLAVISPHRRDNVLRFGDYDTTSLHIPPGPFQSSFATDSPEAVAYSHVADQPSRREGEGGA
ncbi:hypothetical protein [Streptomyces huasconensis]|uniref:hypothetical protein n=1 Tax=Streptomyces huasconensis TaxID=1854574 RepID=UPI0033CCB98D